MIIEFPKVPSIYTSPTCLTLKSYAKINLNLRIIGRRDDGYHLLQSVFYPFENLYDEIVIKDITNLSANDNVDPNSDNVFGDKVIVHNASYIPAFNESLISKTLKLLREIFGFTNIFEVTLHKNIPIGGGLGGGSSNAATVICGVDKMLKLQMSYKQKVDIASKIGADVPFFIQNKPSVVEGIGEKITVIPNPKNYFILLAVPDFYTETPMIYKEYKNQGEINQVKFSKALMHKNLISNEFVASNDLQPMVESKYPDIKLLLNSFKECNGCLGSSISGSGSSCFGIFKELKSMKYALNSLRLLYPKYNFFCS